MILTTGRTGSELLVSLLDAHPLIGCAGELLRDGRAFPNSYVAAQGAKAGWRGRSAYGWKLLLSHFRRPGGTVRGIGDPERYPARLHEMGYKLILLVRRNPVLQAISYILGEQRQFHYGPGEDQSFSPVTIDPVDLIAATWIFESDTRVLCDFVADLPHLSITYEDHLLDAERQQSTIDTVCGYLDLGVATVRSDLRKVTPRDLPALVTNYDEIRELFERTRYQRFVSAG